MMGSKGSGQNAKLFLDDDDEKEEYQSFIDSTEDVLGTDDVRI
jgi:hypothetical protein